jgi:hypothetical protein
MFATLRSPMDTKSLQHQRFSKDVVAIALELSESAFRQLGL